MRVITVAEAAKMTKGELVPALKGTVKRVFDRFTGTNTYGDYSLQTIVLADGPAEIKLKLNDRDEFPAKYRGEVYFASITGDKGLTGLKIDEDTYKGMMSMVVKVTKSAEMQLHSAAPARQEAPARQAAPATPHQSSGEPGPEHSEPPAEPDRPTQPAAPVPGSAADQAAAIGKVKAFLGRKANVLILCTRAAAHVCKTCHVEFGLPTKGDGSPVMIPDLVERIAVHLAISVERENLGDGLPTKQIE